MISLIAGIKSRLPEADWPVVVAALRSEPQTWAELQDPVFAAQVLEAAGADRDRWSPAFIGLLRLDQQQLFEPLRAAPMQPVTEKLRYQAAAVYEKLAGKGAVGEQPTPDLSQATLLALALRERRRLLGGWDQLADDLSIASAEFWRLPISCLFGLMPNPQELLAQLISIDQSTELQQLGLHALLSNPLPLDVQSAHLLELVRDFPLPHFLTLLRSITNVNAPLAQQAAVQALENLQDRDHGNNPGLSEIQRLLLEAEVRQISGQSAQADSLLRSAWEASRQLEVDLAAKVAEANGADVDAVAALQESADPKKIRNRSKRPTSLLAAANVAFKSGDATEAKELAVAALRSATKETEPADSRKASLLRQLSDLFVELELTEEALFAAEAALQAQPNDAECALQFSKLLLKNEKTVEALQQAHLAVALAPDRSEVRRNLAKALQNNHQPVGAFREWKAMLDHEAQPTIEDWLSFAESGLQSNHIDEAIKTCQYALALQPTNGAAYALLGSALLAQGDEGSALAYLRRATELAPAQIEAWLALAQLQIARKAPQEALTALISAQQFTQPSARLQGLLATIFQTLGRDEEALATYEKAAQLADEQVDTETAQSVAFKYSRLQKQTGQRQAALRTLELAQQAFPNNSSIAAELGRLLLEFNEPKRALSSLKQALQADPENLELLMDIARTQLTLSELAAEAEQTLEIVLAHKNAPGESYALMAEAKAKQGKYSEAIKGFDAALKSALADDKIWSKRLVLGKARSQSASGKPVAAVSALQALDKEQPGDLEVQRELCVCYQQAGRGDEAAQIAQRIYLDSSQDEETIIWYADLMGALDKSTEACKALSNSRKSVVQNPHLLLSLAKLQWLGESPKAAQKTLSRLTQLDDSEALTQAGLFLLDRGAAQESISYFQGALEFSAPQVDVLENLALAYIQTEHWAEAIEHLDKAIQLAPHKPLVLEQKANALWHLGRPQAALEALEAALQLLPKDVNLLARKAQILRDNQDWITASEAAAKAFDLDTSHPGNLQSAAELAVVCLQFNQARGLFNKATLNSKAGLALACLQAELALEEGQEIEAAKALALALDETHPRVLAMQSQLAACRGDRSLAVQLLQQAVEARNRQTDPDMFTAYGVAKAAEKLNDWQTAISLYEGLLKSSPGQALAQFSLGRALLLRAEWQQLCEASHAGKAIPDTAASSKEARGACIKALAAASAVATDAATQAMMASWRSRAELRFGAKLDLNALPPSYPTNAAEAAALLSAAHRSGEINAAEQRAKAFLNAPDVLVEKAVTAGETDIAAAFEFIRQAAAAVLQSAPVQALAAQIAYKAGEIANALPFIQRALASWPEPANWQAMAGEIQQVLGNLLEAKGHFKIATELEPENARHYFALGKVQLAAHSVADGVQSLQQAIKLEPTRAEYLIALASAHRMVGDSKQAKSCAQQAQKLSPRDPNALLLQAELALEVKDGQNAKALVQEALKIAPKNTSALRLFAESLQALGETDDAIAVLDRARETAEDEVPLLIRRAELLPDERGLDALVKLSQRYPDRPEVFFALSEALAADGSLTEAIQAAQRAAKKAGETSTPEQLADLHLHLGKLLKQSGNLDQSLHHLDQAAKLAPHSTGSHIERGRVFLARRQHKQALQAFQQAAALAPYDATPHFEVGLALKETKDYSAAEAELRKAAKLAPKDRQIQRQLAALIALNFVHSPAEDSTPLRAEAPSQTLAMQGDGVGGRVSERGNPQERLQELSK